MMGEDCLNSPQRRKIEVTVLQILKASDLETITEFNVRSAAAGRLGFELSGLNHRRFVRQLVDRFLLSEAADILRTTSLRVVDNSSTEHANHITKQPRKQQMSGVGDELEPKYDGKVICKLSDKRRVTVHDLKGTTMVAIRDFYIKDGNMLPEKGVNSGVSMAPAQWSTFKNNFPSIQEAILKLESQSRSAAVVKQSEADVTNSVADSATEKSQSEAAVSSVRRLVFHPIKRKRNESEADLRNSVVDSTAEKSQSFPPHIKSKPIEADTPKASEPIATPNYQEQIAASRNETESDVSASVQHDTVHAVLPENPTPEANIPASVTSVPSQGHLHYTGNAVHPERLVPIQTTRFDGRNYQSWRHQMEFFLNQLNIAYVLSEERVKFEASAQRWMDDDYMCRHNILNSLCDNLFQLYSQKGLSARELWEELKLAYDDDFGTKRSQINKYIHFQMVDGLSILEQVQELHRLADSVIASGTWIEENFHVSVIVSKLPPSWKESRGRLMQEDFLPLNMLMHRIRVEEESRCSYKKKTTSKKDHAAEPKLDSRLGTRKGEDKRICYSCGKEGHILKNCPDKKSKASNNGKENGVVSPCTDTKIIDAATTK